MNPLLARELPWQPLSCGRLIHSTIIAAYIAKRCKFAS
jgi:hypothetical protein